MTKDIRENSPLPGWELTNDGATASNVNARTLIRGLEKLGAEKLYWGGCRYNKIEDRQRAIRAKIERSNPPRSARRRRQQSSANQSPA
jgi:hypothetical protein